MPMVDPATLPYRPCAGITLFNRDGLVFVGRRSDGPAEPEGMGQWWQMPQGGLEPGEDAVAGARREMAEETSVTTASVLDTTPDWLVYDLPAHLVGKAWKGKYRGQKMKWTAFRFDGDDSEINILAPVGGHKPEFKEWRWERLERLPELIIPFKRALYEQIVTAFQRFAA